MVHEIQITSSDGKQKAFRKGITGLEIVQKIYPELVQKALAIKVSQKVLDLSVSLTEDAYVKILTWQDDEGKQIFWHSSAHLLAQALETLYPGILFGIGPPIAEGFYYDVDLTNVKNATLDLKKVEEKMLNLAQQNLSYKKIPLSKDEAKKYFTKHYNPYKLEILRELTNQDITFYQQGDFIDLCKGPHIPHTGFIKAVKLLNIAGAYWRGNEKNQQLTRIYGITFPTQKELQEYLYLAEEAKKRDHKQLGKQLQLFILSERVGKGLPIWLPKGMQVREKLIGFLRSLQKDLGYQEICTPHIAHKDLYITSGHYEKYSESTFQPIHTPNQEETFLLKPMNCPHHCEVYQSTPHSYKSLPIRLSEFGTVYRYEKHGELNGLTRVRSFTQDDAHIFCTPEQIKQELEEIIQMILHVFKSVGFENYIAHLSLRNPKDTTKYIGEDAAWKIAEQAIQEAAESQSLTLITMLGEAAFYGPKLDFIVKDALKRNWQLGTIQLDYQLPKRFQLHYIDQNNQKQTPIMIHRAISGSIERFIAILLEHTNGQLPLWLAPQPVTILPITEQVIDYGKKIQKALQQKGIASHLDKRNEKINRKIRDAELKKTPLMLVIGTKEKEAQTVTLRKKTQNTQKHLSFESCIKWIDEACKTPM